MSGMFLYGQAELIMKFNKDINCHKYIKLYV